MLQSGRVLNWGGAHVEVVRTPVLCSVDFSDSLSACSGTASRKEPVDSKTPNPKTKLNHS